MTRLRWWVLALVITGLAGLLLLWARSALAHDWYSSTKDPVWDTGYCGGHDCAPVNPEWVTEEPGGFRLRMTVEQARTVNPETSAPIDAFIPWNSIFPVDRNPPRAGVICFFATPTM